MRKQFHKQRLVSFAAGVSVAYFFLHLFPQLYLSILGAKQSLQQLTFFSMLFGFVIYHVVEKWIYQHAKRDEIKKEIELEHAFTLFFYHIAIGIVFVSIIRANVMSGLLYFIPLSLHVIINAFPYSPRFRKTAVKLFFTSAPAVGAAFAILVPIPTFINIILLGIVAGILLFVEAREIMPKKRSERVLFFIAGVVTFAVIITLTRSYVGTFT